MKTKGFTLVELFIVIVLIGLLAAMVIPAFQKVSTAANRSQLNNVVESTITAMNRAMFTQQNMDGQVEKDLDKPNVPASAFLSTYPNLVRVLGPEPTPVSKEPTERTYAWLRTPERLLKASLCLDVITTEEYTRLLPFAKELNLTLVPTKIALQADTNLRNAQSKEEILYPSTK